MSDLKRYGLETTVLLDAPSRIREHPEGEYVRYVDHAERLAKLEELQNACMTYFLMGNADEREYARRHIIADDLLPTPAEYYTRKRRLLEELKGHHEDGT